MLARSTAELVPSRVRSKSKPPEGESNDHCLQSSYDKEYHMITKVHRVYYIIIIDAWLHHILEHTAARALVACT